MKSKWVWALLLAALGTAVYAGNVLATPSVGIHRDDAREGDLREDLLPRTHEARNSGTSSSRRRELPTSTFSKTPGSPAAAPAGTRIPAPASSSSRRAA